MNSITMPNIPEIFKSKIIISSSQPGLFNLNIAPLDADPITRTAVLNAFFDIIDPIKPNFLISYAGHTGYTALLAHEMKIGYDTAVKEFDHLRVISAKVIQRTLQDAESHLNKRLQIVFIDDLIESGEAAAAVVKKLRDLNFQVDHAVFLVETTGGEGRKKLLEMGVETFSLATYSPENGFGPGLPSTVPISIAEPNGSAHNTTITSSASDASMTSQHNKYRQPNLVIFPVHSTIDFHKIYGASRPHNMRPGNFPKAQLI